MQRRIVLWMSAILAATAGCGAIPGTDLQPGQYSGSELCLATVIINGEPLEVSAGRTLGVVIGDSGLPFVGEEVVSLGASDTLVFGNITLELTVTDVSSAPTRVVITFGAEVSIDLNPTIIVMSGTHTTTYTAADDGLIEVAETTDIAGSDDELGEFSTLIECSATIAME